MFNTLVVLVGVCWRVASSKVVGGAVLPHGDFAYNPELARNGSWVVHVGAIVAGKYIQSLEADVIVLITPHGQAVSNDFAIYTNSKLHGSTVIENETITAQGTVATDIVDDLFTSGLCRNCTKLSTFENSEPQPIRWGEIIPLHFLPKEPRFIIISVPSKRHESTSDMTPELVELGEGLFTYFESRPERFAFVGSSDLAHTHLESGPYGFSKTAKPFDDAVCKWASDPLKNGHLLLNFARKLVDQALSCGYSSLVVLHSLMVAGYKFEKYEWNPQQLACAHPTYYGMLVSFF
uniref:Extradiol ring-cleavage dioxygenase class III enzyme subunit B domain-containing protein n=1 Tax=Mucochytrium quahogii TaxID=96639 RepID=A0A7S2S8F6_9STRA|mmetsp:Transcript_24446/g.39709  ORF Transcript_24446/g.39709 Transcript_24446/m.39709 type:complete len:292 (+) Transcript_24446:1630-2505(+)